MASTANTAQPFVRELLVPNPKLRLREQVREVMRFKHYSVRTEESYWNWMRQFILFHGKKHEGVRTDPFPMRTKRLRRRPPAPRAD